MADLRITRPPKACSTAALFKYLRTIAGTSGLAVIWEFIGSKNQTSMILLKVALRKSRQCHTTNATECLIPNATAARSLPESAQKMGECGFRRRKGYL